MYAWEAKASLCLHVQSCPMHTACTTAAILLVEEVLAETHQRLSAYTVYQGISGSVHLILICAMHVLSETTRSAWVYSVGCAGICSCISRTKNKLATKVLAQGLTKPPSTVIN
jgi:hypothetical protein